MFRRPSLLWQWLPATLVTFIVSTVFLATTDDVNIWPLRNLLYYRLAPPLGEQPAGVAEIFGCVRDTRGQPVPTATVLIAEPDGTVHQDTAGTNGCYHLEALPAGRYVPLASAPGHEATTLRHWGLPVTVEPNSRLALDMTLPDAALPALRPGTQLTISAPVTRTWNVPRPGTALRRQISFNSDGQPNQLTFLYTPLTSTQTLPTLLTVYPGPVESWEGVSIPLTAVGYAVIAIGPEYTFDFEADIDELQRLVAFARAGHLPGTDGRRIALLGGSYSSLHVFRLLQRDTSFRGALLLGPPTDLFDLRLRFEEGTFFPPFGLDRALIALGYPNTSPERYWRYSFIYHLRRDMPPIALLHSRDDEVVPFQQSELLAAELERLNIAHEAFFFDGMSHYLLADRASPELDKLYTFTLDFLRQIME